MQIHKNNSIYLIINCLGYTKGGVINCYCPHNEYVAFNVNKTRKMLYLIFDNLPHTKVKQIFSKIQKDPLLNRKTLRIPDEHDPFYFELPLLDLEFLNYISLNNLNNLKRIFKEMEMFHIEDKLKSFKNQTVVRDISYENQNLELEKKLFLNNPISKKLQLVQDNINETSITQEQSSLSSIQNGSLAGNYYPMNQSTPGIVLIISNKYFFTEIEEQYKVIFNLKKMLSIIQSVYFTQHLLPKADQLLSNREGTEIDEKALTDTFLYLKFGDENIFLKKGRKHTEIMQDIKDAANKVTKDHSSFFVIILTHGEKGLEV